MTVVRRSVILVLVTLIIVAGSSMAAAQTAGTKTSAARVTELLHGSGYEFTQKTPEVWYINFNGKNLKQFKVILATQDDLLVTFVIIAPNARLRVTPDFMRSLLQLNSKLDRVKIGLDGDGDLFVRTDSSVRILDPTEFKAVLEQVSAATDEVYTEVSSYITPVAAAK